MDTMGDRLEEFLRKMKEVEASMQARMDELSRGRLPWLG